MSEIVRADISWEQIACLKGETYDPEAIDAQIVRAEITQEQIDTLKSSPIDLVKIQAQLDARATSAENTLTTAASYVTSLIEAIDIFGNEADIKKMADRAGGPTYKLIGKLPKTAAEYREAANSMLIPAIAHNDAKNRAGHKSAQNQS